MKRILTSALVLALSFGAAQAQSTEKGDKAGRHMQREIPGLNLTADQKAKMKELHQRQRQEMESLRSQNLSQDALKAKRQEMHEKYRSEMRSILTPEQQQKMDQFRKDHQGEGRFEKGDRKGDRGDKGGFKGDRAGFDGARVEKMARELNLTAAQQDQLKSIYGDFQSRREQIRNSNATDEQKKTQIRDLSRQQMEAAQKVLTPEQLAKSKEMRKEFRNRAGK